MAEHDSWGRKLAEKIADKVFEHLVEILVASGAVGLVIAYFRNFFSSPTAPWVLVTFLVLLVVAVGLHARFLGQRLDTARRDQDERIAAAIT